MERRAKERITLRHLASMTSGLECTAANDELVLVDGDFLTVNRFIDIWSRVQYEKQIGNRWYITSDYLFRFYHYYRYKNYFPVNAGINAIELGLKFKL